MNFKIEYGDDCKNCGEEYYFLAPRIINTWADIKLESDDAWDYVHLCKNCGYEFWDPHFSVDPINDDFS